MTDPEFSAWWFDFTATYPDVGLWVSGLPNGSEVLGKWREKLANVDPRDAESVTVAMAEARIEPIGTTDHERGGTGRRIAREARAFAGERFQRERIASAVGRGDDHERTYRCSCCRDRGLVTVVNPVHFNARKLIVDDMNAACTCDAGAMYRAPRTMPGGTKRPPLQTYNRYVHFRAMDGVTTAVCDEFREWLADESRRVLVTQEAGRSRCSDFDTFNEPDRIQQEAF